MKRSVPVRLLFLFLLGFSGPGYLRAQPPKALIGRVLDQETGRGVGNASLINKRTRAVGHTNASGNFYIPSLPGDSIIITSPSHGRAGIRWEGVGHSPVVRLKRQLTDEAIDLPEVTIRGKQEAEMKRELEKLLSEPEARRNLSAGEVVELAQSPITLLYELFSKQAKANRKLAVLMQEDRRRKLAGYRFALVSQRATDLKGDELARFRDYCNLPDEFILQASEYELTFEILQRLKRFKGN